MHIRKPRKFSLKAVIAVNLGLWLLIAGLVVALDTPASHRPATSAGSIGAHFAHVGSCRASDAPACRAAAPSRLHRA